MIIYSTYHCQNDIRKQNVNFSILKYKSTFLSICHFFLYFIKTYCCSTFYCYWSQLFGFYIFSYKNTTLSLLIKINSQSLYFSVNTCTVPTVTNATAVPASSVDYDSNVTYTCVDGYSHTAGDLTRSCNADGSLTGTPPVCTSELQWQCWFSVL